MVARLHAFEHASVDPLRDTERAGPRVDGLDRDPLPDERLETPCRTVQCVALGQA